MARWPKFAHRLRRTSRRNFLKLLATSSLATVIGGVRKRPVSIVHGEPAGGVRAADLRITGTGFEEGTKQGVSIGPDGLSLGRSAAGSYVSPVMEAPLPFNAIIPQWEGINLEEGFQLRMRTAAATGEWSPWYEIRRNDDWTRPEDNDVVGDMLAVPAADVTHTTFQYQVDLGGTGGVPLLQELRFTCIDATQGPSAAELRAQAQAARNFAPNLVSSYPKPPVVPRTSWCTDAACNYSNGLEYEPVTHLIVHHTVSSNPNADWPAAVRSVWYFHTFSRGWGDIGYNYLVDPNGTLYEGHLGGDDVIGTHASGANAGSMAISMIGDYTNVNPSWAMRNAVVELLAWKATQKGINVYDAGRLPYVAWGLPKLMGHRDAYGTTACPGNTGFTWLPWIRDEVARRIGFTSDYIYVDELSGSFTKSNANWYDGPYGCGFGGHSFYTWSTTDQGQSTNWGEWQLPILQDGWYEVAVYAPFGNTGRGETFGAKYRVTHANGASTVVVNQESNLGVWVVIGNFYFLASGGGKVYLSDLVTTDDGRGVWFDAIRLHPRFSLPLVTVANQQPTANAWKARSVQFSWAMDNPVVIGELRMEIARDEAFTDIIVSQLLSPSATTYTHSFNQDYPTLYWRLHIKTLQNRFILTSPIRFGVDVTSPVSVANTVLRDSRDGRYIIVPTSSDGASGVASVKVDYRLDGDPNWQSMGSGHAQAAFVLSPSSPNQKYWFRSQATDKAGNVEAPHGTADSSTDGAIPLDEHDFLPQIVNQ